jgi:hypothetical protein
MRDTRRPLVILLPTAAPYSIALTLSGTDREIDWTSQRTMTVSTIKPLDQGDCNWADFLAEAEREGGHPWRSSISKLANHWRTTCRARSRNGIVDYVISREGGMKSTGPRESLSIRPSSSLNPFNPN